MSNKTVTKIVIDGVIDLTINKKKLSKNRQLEVKLPEKLEKSSFTFYLSNF